MEDIGEWSSWKILALFKEEIIAAVQDFFFVTWVMPDGVNDTAIVLIHKVPHPQELKDFL